MHRLGQTTDQKKSFLMLEPRSNTLRGRVQRAWQFPWGFAAASAAAVVSAHWLAYETLKRLSHTLDAAWVAAGALVLLFTIAFFVYTRRGQPKSWDQLVALCTLLLLIDLASLAVHKAFPNPWMLIVFAPLLVFAVRSANRRREVLTRIYPMQVFRWSDVDEAKRAAAENAVEVRLHESATDLILLLSLPNVVPFVDANACVFTDGKGNEARLTRDMSLADAIAALQSWQSGPPPNWQQIFRGIEPHLETLERVYLVGSPASTGATKACPGPMDRGHLATHGSDLYADDCEAMLRLVLRPGVEIRHEPAVQFDDIHALESTISELVHKVIPAHGRQRIVVETTGAMKSTSIAGAIATLKGETTFQYVVTNPPFPILLHDLRIDEPPGFEP